MSKNLKVFIDPSSRILYSSFYIKGLNDVIGERNVFFSNKYFKPLKRKEETHSYDHYMAFVVIHRNKILKRIVIDFRDKPSIKESAYEWADKYAKINFNLNLTRKTFHDKIISIPPGYGINIWNTRETRYYCYLNYLKCNFSPVVSWQNHRSDYLRQLYRPKLEDYLDANKTGISENGLPYIFMIGTLWPHINCLNGTNLFRKTFIEVCKTMHCTFEGGLYATEDHPQYEIFKEMILTQWYTPQNYVEKTKLSAVAFNTPAVFNCHGWKLGEYLSMGKAIISTPIINELPEKLEHGKNVHIVTNADEMKSALNFLLSNDKYRLSLENGAREYYKKFVSPKSVIEYILREIV